MDFCSFSLPLSCILSYQCTHRPARRRDSALWQTTLCGRNIESLEGAAGYEAPSISLAPSQHCKMNRLNASPSCHTYEEDTNHDAGKHHMHRASLVVSWHKCSSKTWFTEQLNHVRCNCKGFQDAAEISGCRRNLSGPSHVTRSSL